MKMSRTFNPARLFLALMLLLAAVPGRADEGMWLINALDAALEKKMQERGLLLNAKDIYDADAPGATFSDAVIALGFYCTGSMVSPDGLLITNHHCAFGDIHALSTPEHNYLEEGFWAMTRAEELPVPGKQVFFLKKVLDVTDEVAALKQEMLAQGQAIGGRKLSFIMEKRYKEQTGLEASLNAMWAGEKYYMMLYREYTDLRLVAAPPVSIAAFGGDEDNWEWPQQKCDFTLYRLYENDAPYRPEKWLKIAPEGVREGDYTMVIGYPGRTRRYASSYEVENTATLSHPITTRIRKGQMAIINRWMEADPALRLKYSDTYFSLSNVQELNEGEMLCWRRFGVVEQKRREEKRLQAWIDADPARKARWGNLLKETDSLIRRNAMVEANRIYFRETLFRGMILTRSIMRMGNARDKQEEFRRALAETDPRVEHDLLVYSSAEYFAGVDSSFYGPYQRELMQQFHGDVTALAEYLWDQTFFTRPETVVTRELYENDPLVRFVKDVGAGTFNERNHSLKNRNQLSDLGKEYTRALYAMRQEMGIPQYPDANSTMRLSYGRVGSLEPWDGVHCSWKSTVRGLVEKRDVSRHDFAYDDKFAAILAGAKQDMVVNFLTDNDITGGNSGSPVLNARGELVGLAFDGNKESLASDAMVVPGYNKCVCVDIRYVLFVLSEYAGLKDLVRELTQE